MKPNSKTQSDVGLAFSGAESIAPKHSTKYMTNQYTGYMNDGRLVNKGRGPTKGNTGSLAQGPKTPPTSALPASVKIKDPDYINGGAQVRNPGGTRSWSPSGTENYNGNIDKMNVGRGPTKGNSQ